MNKRIPVIVAGLATVLAVGIGGTAAASHLITSKQIKDHSIKVKDLRKNAVKKLKGQTGLTGATGAAGVKGLDGKTGPAGPVGATGVAGPQGVKGDTGDVGPTGLTGPAGPVGATGADSTVPGPQGLIGPAGPAGADSTVPGPQGPQGEPGVAGTVQINAEVVSTVTTGAVATCPEGTTLVGGGGEAKGTGGGFLIASMPNGANGWVVKVKENSATYAVAYAICAA